MLGTKRTLNTTCFATGCLSVHIPEQTHSQHVLMVAATKKVLENHSHV